MASHKQSLDTTRVQAITDSYFDRPDQTLLKTVLVNNAALAAIALRKSAPESQFPLQEARKSESTSKIKSRLVTSGTEESMQRIDESLVTGATTITGRRLLRSYVNQMGSLFFFALLMYMGYVHAQEFEAAGSYSPAKSKLRWTEFWSLAVLCLCAMLSMAGLNILMTCHYLQARLGWPAESGKSGIRTTLLELALSVLVALALLFVLLALVLDLVFLIGGW